MPEFVTPPPMERGDRVAVVAPSSGAAAEVPHVYEQGLRRLREVFDLEPVEYPTTEKNSAYLESDPEARARDVEEAFRDPDVGGVVTTIGGYDQLRVLDHLDAEVLREHPTRFYGYSDNTNVGLALWNQGVVSYQGPSVMTQFAMGGGMHDYTVEHVERAFFNETMGTVGPAEGFTDETVDWADEDTLHRAPEMEDSPGWRWHDADADPVTGRLWGGCLEILAMQLMAGEYLPDPAALDGGVLYFETSEQLRDAPYVTEVLLGMGERGLLERFDAVVVGRAKARHLEDRPPEARTAYRERQREAVADVVDLYNPDAPVLFDFDCGHTDPMAPVPLGARVTLDPGADSVEFHGA
jgi:muramoyltetrapeptide carboxypeptidase LdcA involved in peptidoglycan recycling